MVNVRAFMSAMKISSLKRLLNESEWKAFTCEMFPQLTDLPNFGVQYATVVINKIENPFWKDVLKHYRKLYFKCNPVSISDFMGECIHYNTHILRDGKIIFVQEWYDHGIFFIYQLISDTGSFMNFQEFVNRYPRINVNFLTFHGILNAVRAYCQKLKLILKQKYKLTGNKTWICLRRGSKLIQNTLNYNESSPTAIPKWNYLFENLNWKGIFSLPHKTSSDVQLKWFQLRLLHRLLPTQRFLFLRRIVDSSICNFCEQSEQTLCLMLFDCNVVRDFWLELQHEISQKYLHCFNLTLDKELVLFGMKENVHTDTVLDFIILFAKFYLYKCKLQNKLPQLTLFTALLKDRHKIERYMAIINGSLAKFEGQWFLYTNIIENDHAST